jgi:homoserine kinase
VAGLLAAREHFPVGLAPPGRPDADAGLHDAGLDDVSLDDGGLLRLATRLEGHPDNVAACLAGGLTIAWTDVAPRLARLEPVHALIPVLCVPEAPVLTAHARQALPQVVPHADAAANAGRAALLVTALTQAPDLLLEATEDFLHQRYRAASMPATADLLARLRAAGVPAVLSGAGPAVLALTVAGRTAGADTVTSVAATASTAWQVLPLTVDREGALVQSQL